MTQYNTNTEAGRKQLVDALHAQATGWSATNWPVEKREAAHNMRQAAALITALERSIQALEEITGKVQVAWGVGYPDPWTIMEETYETALSEQSKRGRKIYIRYQGEWNQVTDEF